MSILGLPVLFGPLVGPLLAGWIIDHTTWRLIFAVNLPIGAGVVALGARLIPSAPRAASPRLDGIGLALLPVGSILLVLSLTLFAERGPAPLGLAMGLAGLAALGAFVLRALLIDQPLIELRLLRIRSLASGGAIAMTFGAAYFGGAIVLPLYIQAVRGDPATVAGALAIPQALAVGVAMQIATRRIDRASARSTIGAAMIVSLAGTAGLAVSVATNAPYPVILACTIVFGIGSGGTIVPAMTAAMRRLSPGELPSGATLLGLAQQLATSIGVAVVTLTLVTSLDTIPIAPGIGVGALMALSDAERAQWLPELGPAVAVAYVPSIVLILAALTIAVIGLPDDRGARAGRRTGAAH